MADKKLTSSASSAAPAPAASSSASVANPARAAVAEAKLDMSLDDILKKKRTEEPKKKTKKLPASKPTKRLDAGVKQKLGAIVKQAQQRAKADERRKRTLASVKAKTIGKAQSVGVLKSQASGRSGSISDDLSKRIQMPLGNRPAAGRKTVGQKKGPEIQLYRPPKAVAVSSPELKKGTTLKIVIPPRSQATTPTRTPVKKPARAANGGGVIGTLRAAATAAVHQRQQTSREEQLNAKRRIIVPGQQIRVEPPAASPAAPKTLNDRFSQMSPSSSSSTPRLRISATSGAPLRQHPHQAKAPVSAPRFSVTLKGASSAPNPKIGARIGRGGGGEGGSRVGGRGVTSSRGGRGAANRNVSRSDQGASLQSRLGGVRSGGGRGRGGKFQHRR